MRFTPRAVRLLRIAMIAIVGVLLLLFLRNVEWDKLAHALRHASLVPLLLSSVIYFVCLFGKALSWRLMLAPRNVVSIWRLYRYTLAAFAASALTPARAGELLRLWALKARDNVPASDATGVAIAEKLLDAITLLLVCAPAPFLLPQLPGWVTTAMLVCGGVAVGLLLVMFFAVGHIETRESRSWFAKMIGGMHVVRAPKRLALTLFVLVLTWCADLIAVVLVLHAVNIEVPIGAAMFILFTFNLAVAIPATPGQVGTLQVGALAATSVLRIPEEPALAFALLYQAMQLAPLLILAFALELDLMRGRTRSEPQPAS